MRKYVLISWFKIALGKFKGFLVHSKSMFLLIAVGLLLNVVPAKIALAIGLPLYLDCIGTVVTAMLGGYLPAVVVGFGVNVINGISEPVAMYYGVLSVLIAITATFFFRWGFFKKAWKLLIVIFSFALIGGGLGSVFTYAIYGFNFGEGISAPFSIAFHDVMHWGRFISQLLADFVIDVFDKSAIVVIAVLIFHFVPQEVKEKLKKIYSDPSSNAMNRMVKHSLLNKVIIIVMVAEILLGSLASTIGFFLYRNNSINNFISIGKGVTEAASVAIDAEKVDDYIARGFEVEGYQKVRSMLERIRASFPQTRFLYVYRIEKDGCHVVFDLDVDGEPGSEPGSIVAFDESFISYLPKLLEGEEIEPIVSDDQYGWLLTVYRPVRNAAGKTVAYVAADISMESIVQDEAMFFIKLLSLFFGLSIIIMSIVIEVMKRGVVIPVNKMSLAAYKFSLDIGLASGIDLETESVDLDGIQNSAIRIGKIGINSNDEIGMLYDSFNGMAQSSFEFIKQVQDQNDRIRRMQELIIMEFAEMVEARDKSTGDHIKKTAEYVEAIAKELQAEGKFKGVLTDAYIHKLKRAAPLHDIGKIAVSDLILNKNGKLTDEEFTIMKSHTTEGGKILRKIVADAGDTFDTNYLNESIEMACFHHEKWDGSGYPTHIKGDEIPLSARIMAVADVFDALIAERVYKKPFSYEKAMSIITEGAGKHFDPDVVEAFTKISEKLYLARTRVSPQPEAGETEPKA